MNYKQHRMFRSDPIIKDSLKKNNLTKCGHLFKKTFREGEDDKLLLEPHRDHDGVFIYNRYKNYVKDDALLVPCSCNHYGKMCQYCIVLNTSDYYGMDVPLNPEDFETMKKIFLKDQGWTENNFYSWLEFWIKTLENKRWTGDYTKEFVFLRYRKFFYKSTHQIFYYIFQFITSKKVFLIDPENRKPLPVDVNGGVIKKPHQGQKTLKDCVAIITGDAMIRLSYHLYKKSGRVVSYLTNINNTYTVVHYTYKKDPRRDTLSFIQKISQIRKKMLNKRIFQYTIDEINNEVKFRPGMCGMEDCHISFMASTKMIV